MFPDSKIGQSYSQDKTKIRYNIQYVLAPYVKQILMYLINNSPSVTRDKEIYHLILR